MVVSVGQLAEASHYNTVAEDVNKVFGDKYNTAAVTDSNRKATHKFGWGAVNIDDAVPIGDLITAQRLQYLVDRTNVSVDHIDVTDSLLVFAVPTGRDDVTVNTPIRAEDLNIVQSKFNTTILVNDAHTTVDPTNASALSATPTSGGPLQRTNSWQHQLTGEYYWDFDSYNHCRYFFNSGGQLRVSLSMSGGSTAGYYNWADVINEMGTLSFTWNNVIQSNSVTVGTSENKGVYDLTELYGDGDGATDDQGLLFTSSGVTLSGTGYGYGYGASNPYGFITGAGNHPAYAKFYANTAYTSSYSTYSSYQNLKFKLYGKYSLNGRRLHFKLVLDDTSFDQVIDGTVSASLSYLMPDTITRGSATFDVNPDPTVAISDDFNGAFDS